MIVDALIEANPMFHFEEKIRNPAEYVGVTDSILPYIESSKKQEFKGAKDILRRVRTRDLYRFLGSTILLNKEAVKKHVTAEAIVGH